MKTKIGVAIHKTGSENDVLLKLVGNVNEKGIVITIEAVCNYLIVRNAIYPNLHSFAFSFDEVTNTLHISEDGGKTYTLSLTWKEVEELAAAVDDIPANLYTQS